MGCTYDFYRVSILKHLQDSQQLFDAKERYLLIRGGRRANESLNGSTKRDQNLLLERG